MWEFNNLSQFVVHTQSFLTTNTFNNESFFKNYVVYIISVVIVWFDVFFQTYSWNDAWRKHPLLSNNMRMSVMLPGFWLGAAAFGVFFTATKIYDVCLSGDYFMTI